MDFESSVPSSLRAFLLYASEDGIKALTTLSAAVALTDDVGSELLSACGPRTIPPDTFIERLHSADFIVERNGEWHIECDTRFHLLKRLSQDSGLARLAHSMLLGVANTQGSVDRIRSIPGYLSLPAGLAYHRAALSPSDALNEYRTAFNSADVDTQWLLGVLASEQQALGIIPANSVEPAYFQGVVAYREERFEDAQKWLMKVAASEEMKTEVAEAQYLLGKLLWGENKVRAEEMLRESLHIFDELYDLQGKSRALHILGRLLWPVRRQEAARMLQCSIRTQENADTREYQSQVFNSLGTINRCYQHWEEARSFYTRALEESHDPRTQAVAHVGLSYVAEHSDEDVPTARKHMRKAILCQKRTDRRDLVAKHEMRLRSLGEEP